MNSENKYSPLANISAPLADVAVNATIMPASTTETGSRPRRQVSERINPTAAMPPAKATRAGENSMSPGANKVAMVIASCAPAEMPNVEGSASGLRRTRCNRSPARPSAAPATMATAMRGRVL